MKLLIIDNYDSFTFNLYQYVGELFDKNSLPGEIEIYRNDEISIDQIRERNYDKIIISPGPGTPTNAAYFGVCAAVITELGPRTPILGVCLGFQGIAHCFGGKIVKAHLPMHGKTSEIEHDSQGVFANLPNNIEVMRYHSLVVDPKSLPDCLEVSAIVSTGESGFPERLPAEYEIMGLRHKEYPIEGVQFHPESFATEGGMKILENFI